MLNLEQCNLFNPGLIYGFEPEGRMGETEDGGSYLYLESFILQKVDMFEALVYAQSVVLPEISRGWDNITPMQVIEWISRIHGLISKTLLSNFPRHIGRYPGIDVVVLRFHHGAELDVYLYELLQLDKASPSYKRIFRVACAKFNIATPDLFQSFVDLCLKIANDTSIEIDPKSKGSLPCIAVQRLRKAWYGEDYLTIDERNLISKFVMICLPADKLPAAMDEFARNVISVMLNCAKLDETALYEALAEIFYQLVSIHPFVNANGRTATVFLNTLLVSLKLPSILLRHPGDREDETSLYSQAMKEINDSREKLVTLIASRIASPPYHSEPAQNLMFLQYELYTAFKNIQNAFGLMCATTFLEKIMQDIEILIDIKQIQEQEGELGARLHYNRLMLTDRDKFFTKSAEFANSKDIKAFAIEKLNRLTGQDWKISQKSGVMIAWMLFTSIEHQQACLTALRNYFAGTESIIKDGKPQGKSDAWMIQIENINLDKLSQVLAEEELMHLLP